ncbi:PAS domain-containing protein [Pararhodobacter sp. SW119]|uniref:PAS domain-containing protein n=1 Tax=Pararhodobacter sp. SW119 TaxID=2780075 RepID=UPI001AE0C663|nr:PAS domain-containing protein [Pararhodobacter sp. SW119]
MTFQAFVDRHVDPVWILDPGFQQVLHANPAACNLMSASCEDLRLRPPSALGLSRGATRLRVDQADARSIELDVTSTSIEWQGSAAVLLGATAAVATTDRMLTAKVAAINEDVAFDWDITADQLVWSPEACARFGLDLASLPKTIADWLALVHPEDRPRMRDALNRILARPEGRRWTGAYRLMRADGRATHVLERGEIQLNAQGRPVRMLGTMIDLARIEGLVPQIALAARNLEEEHRLRHALAEALPVIVFTVDRTGELDFVSQSFHDLTGLPVERTSTAAAIDTLHPEDRARVKELHLSSLDAPRPLDIEVRLRDIVNSGYRWHQVAVRPQYDDGHLVKWNGVGIDIDDRKQAEAALRTSEERHRSLLEMLPVAVWEEDWSAVRALADRLTAEGITDLRAHLEAHPELLHDLQQKPAVASANSTAFDIFAASSAEDIERIHQQWFEEPAARESFLNEVVAFVNGTAPPPTELLVRRADGRPIHVVQRLGFSMGEGPPNRVVHCLNEITDKVHGEERMRVVADLCSDVIWDHDALTGQTWCSEGFRLRYGHDPEVLSRMGARWSDLIHPDDRERVVTAIAPVEAGAIDDMKNEYRFRRADGTYAVVEDRFRVLRDRDGKVRRMIGVMVDVTTERAQDERQRALVQIASDAVFEYDPDCNLIIFGEGFRTVFGIDLVGAHEIPTPLIENMHPQDRKRAVDGFFALLKSRDDSAILEYRLRRGDGRWAFVQERIIVLRARDGTVRRAFAALVDLTAQRQSEERLRLATLASREVVFDWDIASDRLQLSGAVMDRYGYDPSEFPGNSGNFIAQVHPEDRDILIDGARTLRRGEDFPELHEVSFRLYRADGSLSNVISRSVAVDGPTGRPARLVGMILDVTELHREEARMRAIVEVSADAVWEYHPDSNTMVFSDGIEKYFGQGWVGEHPVPSPWREAVHPEDLQRTVQGFEEFLRGRAVRWRDSHRLKRGDGTWAHVEERVVALRDENGRALRVIGSFDDVTERRRLEDQLRSAQKMESIGRIAGGIAHDFNNLLAVIMGNAELAMEDPDTARTEEFGTEIVQACQRGAELTRRLLSFARRSHLAPKVVNLNEVVTGMSRLISRAIPESIEMRTALTAGLWNTRADPTFVESSLLNLVVNARDAMPQGGRLTVETGNMRVSDSYVTERAEELAPGRYVMLAVSDTGTGIAREIIEKVIEPFFTTKGPHLGTGLGLAMVHGFARQSGGALRIYSEPGVGTTVKILLPAEDDAAGHAAASQWHEKDSFTGNGARILLVEDEDAVRRTVARILTERGHSVTEAATGDAALLTFERSMSAFDILLTDVVMPGKLQGPALARELKQRAPGLGVVFMSGYANEAAVHGNGLRIDDLYLMKPIQRRELLKVIYTVAERLREARKG